MANLDKNILITPNVGANGDPTIVFSAANNTSNAANITLRAYPTSNGTLSFEGSAGQLFSITNNLTGTLFSVNDISGIPSIEVLDTGRINLAQYNGSVVIGANTSANASTSNTTGELVVFGGVGVTGNIYSGSIYLSGTANSIVFGDGTVQTTAAGGAATDAVARGLANTADVKAQAAFDRANTEPDSQNYRANTIIVANTAGFLSNSNSFFVASNNAIVVPNVSITQSATASFPLSFGQSLGNKIALYETFLPSNGTGYGFGIQNAKFQIFHGNSGDHTSIGHGNSSGFTEQFRVASVASAVNYLQATGSATGTAISLTAQGSDANVAVSVASKGSGILYLGTGSSGTTTRTEISAGGSIVATFASVSGRTNYVQLTSASSGSSPTFIARSSTDTNVGLTFGTFNAGNIDFQASGDPNAGTGRLQFRVAPTANAVNYAQITGSPTGNNNVILSAQGSDANVSISLLPKGNGSIMITGNTRNSINVANSLYVGGVVGFANANNISVVYQSYNASTNSLDVVFG
jgi:hypothetical protein